MFRNILALTLVLALFTALPAQAQRNVIQATAAEDPIVDNDIVYDLSSETYLGFRPTITVEFTITQRDTDSIGRIDAKFYWVDEEFNYLASRKGSGWPDSTLSFTPTLTDTSLSFTRDNFTFVFDSTKPVIEIDFIANCIDKDGSGDISFAFDTLARPFDNWFHRSTTPYWPGTASDGTQSQSDGWPIAESAKIFTVGGRTIEVGDTVEMDVLIQTPFDPWAGVWTLFTFTDHLDYIGIDTVGTLFSGLSFTATNSNDSLWVYTADSFDVSGTPTLFNVTFVSTATTDDFLDSVLLVKDSIFSGCDFMLDGDADDDLWTVTIPEYTATIDIVNKSMVKNTTGPVTVQLKNNFTVDMDHTHVDSVAAFNPDEDSYDLISWAHDVDDVNSYLWKLWTVDGDSSAIREDDGAQRNSDDISKSSSFQDIAKFDIKAGATTGTDVIAFTRVDSSSSAFQRDSKLKAYNAPIVVYSHTFFGVDSLFKLNTGTVTITAGGGGGGSCPFVYTWDGSNYLLEDVILTQSESYGEGTAVVDYLPLTFKPAYVDGGYRLRIHEQEAEKTFLDHVELLVIEHPIGFDASVDMNGDIVFGEYRMSPLAVEDEHGQDLLALLKEPDGQVYERMAPGQVVATFGFRRGSSSFMIKAAGPPKPPCKLWAGPTRPDVVEPFALSMELEDRYGAWHSLPEGPVRLPLGHSRPFIDLAAYDIGQDFRIRYDWNSHFELDELAIVAQATVQHTIRRVAFDEVSHSSAHPTVNSLYRNDGHYTELVTGEYLDLHFPSERPQPGMTHSFVLVSKGYYLTYFGDVAANRPLHFGLNGNYPNPFNPSTTVRYSLANAEPVTLEIFNVLGQKVKTLVDGKTQVAGSYEITWDGRDRNGIHVASGTYLYILRAGSFIESRKMIMLK